MIIFEHKSLPNVTLSIIGVGARLSVSLNVEPQMVKHLHPNCFKSEKLWVYSISMEIRDVNMYTVDAAYKTLLNRAMINCRKAKQKVLSHEIEALCVKERN